MPGRNIDSIITPGEEEKLYNELESIAKELGIDLGYYSNLGALVAAINASVHHKQEAERLPLLDLILSQAETIKAEETSRLVAYLIFISAAYPAWGAGAFLQAIVSYPDLNRSMARLAGVYLILTGEDPFDSQFRIQINANAANQAPVLAPAVGVGSGDDWAMGGELL